MMLCPFVYSPQQWEASDMLHRIGCMDFGYLHE
jgi:hypothetical protein